MICSRFIEITDQDLKLNTNCRFFTSLEGENPGGSIKDHLVIGELSDRVRTGRLKPGDWISEASAGSTAQALAFYARQFGLKCLLFVPDTLSKTQIFGLQSLGAEVHAVPAHEAYGLYENYLSEHKNIQPLHQLSDATLSRHYANLGQKLQTEIGQIDLMIGAVGTGHSLKGIAEGCDLTPPSIRPLKVTAEPKHGQVAGIRNLETTRYGADDACQASWFDRRLLLNPTQYVRASTLHSSQGDITFCESFRLVLGACRVLEEDGLKQGNVFLIGSANRRI